MALSRDLWHYRELLGFLTWREIKVRYKQTALGAGWALLQPLTTMIIATLFFGRLGGLEHKTGGVPYPLFAFAGLLPWTFFSNALQNGGNSLVQNSNLMTKVYFPRLLLPAAVVMSWLVDLFIAFGLLAVLMVYYHTAPGANIVALPLVFLLLVVLATSLGAALAGVAVRFRDVRYVLPLLTQSLMLMSPVIWPPSIVPQQYRFLLALNPLTGIINGFRAALVNTPLPWGEIGISALLTVIILALSVRGFRRMEASFADVI